MRLYHYVGPADIRRAAGQAAGAIVDAPAELRRWLTTAPDALVEGATFVVDGRGRLRLASRRSEHVACAGGEPVRAAGELQVERRGDGFAVAAITNLSTGYCPEPDCWPAVAAALTTAGLAPPAGFTHAFVFRRCQSCAQINVVKEGWLVCAACDADLPPRWNVAR